jgi:hypothetical protein
VYNILVHGEGVRTFKVIVVKFMTVRPAEGFGLRLAKGCDRIATLNPVNKTSSEAFGIHQ